MSQTTTAFAIRFDAYLDHGTGYTTERQQAWLADAWRKLSNRILSSGALRGPGGVGLAPAIAKDEAGRMIVAGAWLTEELLRGVVADVLGSHAAYTSIRTVRPPRDTEGGLTP